jgi:hypothetical protein
VRRLLAWGLTLLAAAGCGGGGGGGTTAAAPPTTAPITVTTPEDTARAAAKPTGKPRFDVQLSGESPRARAGRPWRYTVRATAKGGGKAGGTAKMRVFVDGELVDTIGYFGFDGTLSRTHRWPTVLRGKKGVVLQAEVEGDGGTQRVNFPVTVG